MDVQNFKKKTVNSNTRLFHRKIPGFSQLSYIKRIGSTIHIWKKTFRYLKYLSNVISHHPFCKIWDLIKTKTSKNRYHPYSFCWDFFCQRIMNIKNIYDVLKWFCCLWFLLLSTFIFPNIKFNTKISFSIQLSHNVKNDCYKPFIIPKCHRIDCNP